MEDSAFLPYCSNCFGAVERGTGCALSCTCFVCGDCSKHFPETAVFERCAFCGSPDTRVAWLSTNSIPTEIRELLSSFEDKFEQARNIMKFQNAHMKRIMHRMKTAPRGVSNQDSTSTTPSFFATSPSAQQQQLSQLQRSASHHADQMLMSPSASRALGRTQPPPLPQQQQQQQQQQQEQQEQQQRKQVLPAAYSGSLPVYSQGQRQDGSSGPTAILGALSAEAHGQNQTQGRKRLFQKVASSRGPSVDTADKVARPDTTQSIYSQRQQKHRQQLQPESSWLPGDRGGGASRSRRDGSASAGLGLSSFSRTQRGTTPTHALMSSGQGHSASTSGMDRPHTPRQMDGIRSPLVKFGHRAATASHQSLPHSHDRRSLDYAASMPVPSGRQHNFEY